MMKRVALIASFAVVCDGSRVAAQSNSRDSTVVVIPAKQYEAGWLHRVLLGADYRDLWTAPIEVPLLNLQTFGGGLTATQRGGSAQTNSLRFKAKNGREYVFRPLEKDFTRWLPPELRETLVKSIVQDQVAGYHPAAALIVARLLDETGIHHPRPQLVVMPNDSTLGEFRADFAGVLGTVEERPGTYFDDSPESLGATDVISTERLFERMRKSAREMVDTRAFLSARLFDVFVGDRDRHRDQWRWARFSNDARALWEPVPRDRDMPFATFQGVGPWVIRGIVPQLVTFGPEYPDMVWLNWNGREMDRRLLVGLERSVWDSSVKVLQAQMSDAVLDSAIMEMPPPFVKAGGSTLKEALQQRRQRLPQAAEVFYKILASHVDLNGTDDVDVADVTRTDDGSVAISLTSTGEQGRGDPVVYLQRRFEPQDTKEVRIILHGGADRVLVRGKPGKGILLRVVSGAGNDTVVDSVPNGDRSLQVYDSSNVQVISPRDIPVDSQKFIGPGRAAHPARPQDPERDWGTWKYTLRSVTFSPGRGLVAGINHVRLNYGFRRVPFARRQAFGLDYSFAELRPRLTYSAEFRSKTPDRWIDLDLMGSGLELIRFHGLGNESANDRSTEYYRVFQNLFRVEPSWVAQFTPSSKIALGAVAQFTSTREHSQTLVGDTHPYGSEEFGQLGAKAELTVDHRDVINFPTKGYRFAAGGTINPPVWNVESAFGQAHVEAVGYASAKGPLQPTLALRAGAQHVWGKFPFHDAAVIGGRTTVRGWDEQRFAGRSALTGTAELRVHTGKVKLIVPADVGMIGFADVGRVFADGEESSTWHSGLGGGIWIAPLMKNYTVSATVAKSKERLGLYVTSGFSF